MRRSRERTNMRMLGILRRLDDFAEIEAAWADEIKQRIEEIRTGAVEAIPADEVMAEMRARFG